MALHAYSLALKKKVAMIDPHISYSKGRYMAMGKSKDGKTLYLFMSETDAKKAIKSGEAKKGMGFK